MPSDTSDLLREVHKIEEERQPEEVAQHTTVAVEVVHAAVLRNGERELCRATSALAWSGLAAGLSMGLSFIAEGVLRAGLPDTPWRPLVAKVGYSFGFVVVILARQQLFTENTLTAFLPLMSRRNMATLKQVARLWSIVLLMNLVGAHIVAWVLGNTPAFPREIQTAFAAIARESASVSFGQAMLRGVFAGWIIALVVWILAAMESHSMGVIVLLTWLVAAGHFTHIIAGSIEVLFLVMTGALPWTSYLGGYMIPTLIGNVLGGVSLVSALNHAQVTAGEPCSVDNLGSPE